ncbi:MAG TPA: cytochrome P450 [Acidimicrobiales bacterium]|nr:cytochrome P450 [Acidimicrobiales bacterium]
MARTEPVGDWTSDFDVLDASYVQNPFPHWDELRQVCPIAHTDRRGRAWLPTTYADVTAMAKDIDHFSSANTSVIDSVDESETPILTYGLPPITSDPPLHTWTRRLLLPWFSHARVESYEPMTRSLCGSLVDAHLDAGRADAAADYAQQIPVRVIGSILGIPEELADTFTGWVRDALEFADDTERVQRGMFGIGYYLWDRINERRDADGDDLLTYLLHAEVDGGSVDDMVVLGMAILTMIAGIDTTWSAIGSSLWHLATNDRDRERLVAEPALMATAVEELLRAYSPVTMARVVTEDLEFNGCPMKQGDKLLLSFPAANRDPAVFDRADEVLVDRQENRHVAFGSGIHRCAGSNLARMELRVALEEWLARVPVFHLAEGAEVLWAGGQVRGPRRLEVVFS